MPVFERAYRHWEGHRTPDSGRFWVIADESLRAALRSRWLWVLFVATVVHVGIRTAIIYFTSTVDIASGAGPEIADQVRFTRRFISDAMGLQARWIVLLVLALVGAPALARDRHAGALQFYFSKPITRPEYAAGKLLPPFLIALALTAGPALVLWVVGMAFTPAGARPDGAAIMPLNILIAGVLIAAVCALVVVAMSGLVQSARLAAAGWVGMGVGTGAVATLMFEITRVDGTRLVGFFNCVETAARTIMDVPVGDTPAGGAWLMTTAWAGAAVAALWLSLRDPEVAA